MLDRLVSVIADQQDVQAALRQQRAWQDALQIVHRALNRLNVYAKALQQLVTLNVLGCAPDAEEAARLKQEGNLKFQRQLYAPAIGAYTDALRHLDQCTEGGRVEASRVYSNRAQALLKLAPPPSDLAYSTALAAEQDASEAIACDASFTKAFYRRACARRVLGQLQDAASDCQQALQAAAKDATSGLDADIQQLLGELKKSLIVSGQHLHVMSTDSSMVGGSTPGARQAAVHAGLLHAHDSHASMGRFWVAACSLPPAMDVLREVPAAAVLRKPARKGHCWHCLKELALRPSGSSSSSSGGGTTKQSARKGSSSVGQAPHAAVPAAPLPCRHCAMAVYCSRACRDADEDTWHGPLGPECGLPWMHLLPEVAVLACRLARMQAAAESDQAHTPTASKKHGEVSTCSETATDASSTSVSAHTHTAGAATGRAAWAGVHAALSALETHADTLQPQLLLEACVLACITADAYSSGCRSVITRQKVTSAAAVKQPALQRHPVTPEQVFTGLRLVAVNAMAVRPSRTAGAEERVAVALYPQAALLNHSCTPSASVRFEGGVVVVRTIHALQHGEPLTISYGPQAVKMPYIIRQPLLMDEYHFTCTCKSCTSTTADASRAGSTTSYSSSSSSSSVSTVSPAPVLSSNERSAWGLKCKGPAPSLRPEHIAHIYKAPTPCPGVMLPCSQQLARAIGLDASLEGSRNGSRPGDPSLSGRGSDGRGITRGEAACSVCSAELGSEREQQVLDALHMADADAVQALADALAAHDAEAASYSKISNAQERTREALMDLLQRAQSIDECLAGQLHVNNLLLAHSRHLVGEIGSRICASFPQTNDAGMFLAMAMAPVLAGLYRSVSTLALHYGPCSTEVGFELQLLAQVLRLRPQMGQGARAKSQPSTFSKMHQLSQQQHAGAAGQGRTADYRASGVALSQSHRSGSTQGGSDASVALPMHMVQLKAQGGKPVAAGAAADDAVEARAGAGGDLHEPICPSCGLPACKHKAVLGVLAASSAWEEVAVGDTRLAAERAAECIMWHHFGSMCV